MSNTIPIEFRMTSSYDPSSPAAERIVPAEWFREALDAGIRIALENAVIDDSLSLQFSQFTETVSLKNCCFRGPIDLSFATFNKNFSVIGSSFEAPVSFRGAHFLYDFELSRTQFRQSDSGDVNALDCTDVSVSGLFLAEDLRLHKGCSASFHRGHFGKSFLASQSHFEGRCNLASIVIDDTLDFRAVFIEGPFSLESGTVGNINLGPVTIRNSTTKRASLNDKAIFQDLTVNGYADFRGCTFNGKTVFNGAAFKGNTVFGATFDDGVSQGATFNAEAEFIKCVFFKGGNFRRTRFQKETLFSSSEFYVDGRFAGADFQSRASFKLAVFHGFAHFAAEVGESLRIPGSSFHKEAVFEHAQFRGDARLEGARFQNELNLRDASFRTLYFRDTSTKLEAALEGKLDLRGLQYGRIVVDWQKLLCDCRDPIRTRLRVYERKAYLDLAQALRKEGKAREANSLLWEWNEVERRQHYHNGDKVLAFGYWVYRVVAHYGIRPFRLASWVLLLLFIGTVFFMHPGTLAAANRDTPCPLDDNKASMSDAFAVSLRYLLPVAVPMGKNCEPTNNSTAVGLSAATFATFGLKLPGWIIVPLGVAALTGVLRRTDS